MNCVLVILYIYINYRIFNILLKCRFFIQVENKTMHSDDIKFVILVACGTTRYKRLAPVSCRNFKKGELAYPQPLYF